MKKITVLTALLAVLAVTAGLLWPGRVLARRERRLYGQIVTGAAAVSAFERGETTLAQRIAVLGSINNTVPAMDFSAGAQLYDDEYTLRRRFVRELRQMGEFFAPASDLEAWLVETEMASGLANYLGLTPVTCLESDSTGGVYLFESENQEQVRYTIHLEEQVWRLYPTS